MSITIKHLAIHQLKKIPSENSELGTQVTLIANEQLVEVSPLVETMMQKLHQLYSVKNKGFAVFTDDSSVVSENGQVGNTTETDNTGSSAFLSLFTDFQQNQADFLDFSQHAAQLLVEEINQYSFAEPGILVICHYHHVANDYLYLALLSHVHSTTINEQFQVAEINYLDIEKSDIMARIDITEWTHNPQSARYLTFLRGRIGRKVGDFFLDFLGAQTGLDPKVQTQALIQAVDEYCAQTELNRDQEKAYKQEVYTFCTAQAKQGEELSVHALSDYLSQDEVLKKQQSDTSVNFADFTLEKGYEFPESFPADTTTLKKLTKFSGSGGGITISFTSQQLGEKIMWDQTTDTLVIKGTPPNLRDQLERFFS